MSTNKKVNKKSKQAKINTKPIILCGIIALVIVIIAIVLIIKSRGTDVSELEEIATKKYFEEGFIDVSELYMQAGASEIDEVQYIQAQTKQALDEYFATTTETTVDADAIKGTIENPYNYTIDFNGIIVSGYEYSQENNTFTKVDGANSNMENIEANVNMITTNYDSQKIVVEKIEKTEDNKYKVYANLVEENGTGEAIAQAEITVRIENNEIVLDGCTIK